MTVQEKTRWKVWADELRQQMMTGLTPEITKSVDAITSETATTKSVRSLRSVRFWKACQLGESPNDVLTRAGFDLEFEQDEAANVNDVTLRLNDSWMTIMNRVIARKDPLNR